MHLSVFAATLALSRWCTAAPIEQHPLTGNGHHAGPHGKPFEREHRDPYDGKIDTVANGMHPLPFVSRVLNPFTARF